MAERQHKVPLSSRLVKIDLHDLVLRYSGLVKAVHDSRCVSRRRGKASGLLERVQVPLELDTPLPLFSALYDERSVTGLVADSAPVPKRQHEAGVVSADVDILAEQHQVVRLVPDVEDALPGLMYRREVLFL